MRNKLSVAGRFGVCVVLSALLGLPTLAGEGDDVATDDHKVVHYEERPDDPPAAVDPRTDPLARSAAARPTKGGFVSVQVNVDALGRNIVGDAANEPSIAVNPNKPNIKVIGWRQFNSVLSNFREAGWAYTADGGQTWTFPGSLEPGVFRSDPVLDSDSAGNLFYQSLYLSGSLLLNDVWKSLSDGLFWQSPVPAFGGDKNWITVDKSGGIGDGHVYAGWQIAGACCGTRTFSRSVDGAASFEEPVRPDRVPLFGTMAVGPDGEVYMAGIDGQNGQNFNVTVVSRTGDAKDATTAPTFTGWEVDLGGRQVIGGVPNPQGLIGQITVAVDASDGATRGNVYVLGSVQPPATGNPADVNIIRSEDGGNSWSEPRRVHQDAPNVGNWHWFGTLSVAPNGRIDAVWYDTRNSGGVATVSEVFYAYSHDGGRSWFGDEPVSPAFNSTVGWPQQNKLGDYIETVSDLDGADLAYAATFNGEQDVYYLRLFPDCNGNGISDSRDVTDAVSDDCNGNFVPDECEIAGESGDDCNENGTLDACDIDAGTSLDCDADGVADECQPDCNANGQADRCDIDDGLSVDCAGDGVPDECEPDCNANGKADSCDLFEGTDGDCNGDGVLDSCEADCDNDGVPDTCSGESDFMRSFVANATAPASAELVDLNGDDAPDLLVAALTDNSVAWYPNDGTGLFGAGRTITLAANGSFAAIAADVDGDLDPDVVGVSLNDDELAWYENLDGAGTFGPQQIISTLNDAPTALAAADLTGDGAVDLAVVSINDNEVAWYKNLGGGTFGPQQVLPPAGGRPRSIVIADLNHDDLPDLLVTAEVANAVVWYPNLGGGGSFDAPRTISDATLGAWSADAADIDGDGDRDVVTAGSGDGVIAWHANLDGNETFGPRRTIGTGRSAARRVRPADMDGDGDPDIVSAAFATDELALHRNDGTGGFDPAVILGDGIDGINGFGLGDVDDDADPDIVTVALIGNTIERFLNPGGDCNGNGIPDACEDDCDGNGIPDSCDIDAAPEKDCDSSGLLDVCETACTEDCDQDADGCLDGADSAPDDPTVCGDTDADGCDDCSAGAGVQPGDDGPNDDTDGICNLGDCAVDDNTLWRTPGPVGDLALEDNGFRTVLTWDAPADPGAIAVRYDVLRSADPANFTLGATCLLTESIDTNVVELDQPLPGELLAYLVRAINDCPDGAGSLGTDSDGQPRPGRQCLGPRRGD